MRQDRCGSRALKELRCSAYTRQMETCLDVTFLRSYVAYVSDQSIGHLDIGEALTGRVYGIVEGRNRTMVSSSHSLCCPDNLQFPTHPPNWCTSQTAWSTRRPDPCAGNVLFNMEFALGVSAHEPVVLVALAADVPSIDALGRIRRRCRRAKVWTRTRSYELGLCG
ncbi:hypothetical protein IG631_14085 [Alternaria alternata]|nr:hypothetical protein IG631_14085 [Alternaria alternata]